MADEDLTPAREGALLAAAVQGVAWALIEDETDTSDRGVSDEHYRDAVRRAQEILPTLLPSVVPEEPEWEYAWEADEAVRTTTRPRGPRILFDGMVYPPEAIASFAKGRRIRRRKAGPWLPVEQGEETGGKTTNHEIERQER